MVIIHTADWHIGKRTNGISRLDEQVEVLKEIRKITEKENADVVIVSGDVFDTPMPPAEAEQVFYRAALDMSAICPLVILSGNHDDPQRLGAPSGIAGACGIYIINSLDNKIINSDVESGFGYIKLRTKNGVLNLAAVPYMSLARLSASKCEGETYTEKMRSLIEKICDEAFDDEGVNVFASHMFMSGSENGDERELGTALQLPSDILPQRAVYCALGHVHKPQTVSKTRNAYYSGSILQYHFDDESEKRVIKVETGNGETKVDFIPIASGRKLVRENVTSFEQACRVLSDRDKLVELVYSGGEPLSGREISGLRMLPGFCKITVQRQKSEDSERETRARNSKSDSELFKAFYMKNVGKEPDEETLNMFLAVLRGEQL